MDEQKPLNAKFAVKLKGKPLKDEMIRAQYAMYLTGKSLSEIAAIYRSSRHAIYNNFKRRGYKLRTQNFWPTKVVGGGKILAIRQGRLLASDA